VVVVDFVDIPFQDSDIEGRAGKVADFVVAEFTDLGVQHDMVSILRSSVSAEKFSDIYFSESMTNFIFMV
jgi:hypothetical protein